MADLSRVAAAENTTSNSGSSKRPESRRHDSVASGVRGLDDDSLSLGTESEKERAIAKAALSVAELGESTSALTDAFLSYICFRSCTSGRANAKQSTRFE